VRLWCGRCPVEVALVLAQHASGWCSRLSGSGARVRASYEVGACTRAGSLSRGVRPPSRRARELNLRSIPAGQGPAVDLGDDHAAEIPVGCATISSIARRPNSTRWPDAARSRRDVQRHLDLETERLRPFKRARHAADSGRAQNHCSRSQRDSALTGELATSRPARPRLRRSLLPVTVRHRRQVGFAGAGERLIGARGTRRRVRPSGE
jgi:hypothetical protein